LIGFNEYTRARFNDGIRALLGMDAQTPAPSVAPEVSPSLDINEQDDPTLFYLRAERLMAWRQAQAAGAGAYAAWHLFNPANSGMLVVVEKLHLHSLTAGNAYFSLTLGSAAGTPGTSQVRDARWPNQRGMAVMSVSSDAVNPSGYLNLFEVEVITFANSVIDLLAPVVIPPGFQLQVGHGTITTGDITVNASGRERSLGQLEA